jgi:polysaccharide export outer membrane protein
MKNFFLGFILLLFFSFTVEVFASPVVFHIGPGDLLEISVWKDESLSREVIVPPDGIISFPLIGDINVNNMTVGNLRNKVKKKLSSFIPDATVTVMIKEINSLKAYVIGKVNDPGEFPISIDTTVMQILSKAGGLNPFASESKIQIFRRVQGKTVRIPFNYKQVENGKKLEQDIILQRGDVVVVP